MNARTPTRESAVLRVRLSICPKPKSARRGVAAAENSTGHVERDQHGTKASRQTPYHSLASDRGAGWPACRQPPNGSSAERRSTDWPMSALRARRIAACVQQRCISHQRAEHTLALKGGRSRQRGAPACDHADRRLDSIPSRGSTECPERSPP